MDMVEGNQSGTGGGLRYITEEATSDMVNQERSHSCQAACARQVLMDAGVHVSEEELLAEIGYYEGYGTTAEHMAPVLSQLHPRLGYLAGSIPHQALAILFKRDPWIADLKTFHGTVHSVVVDGIVGEMVRVRDPWGVNGPGSGKGSTATIALRDFLEHWHWAFNKAVIPNRLK